ncbi:MAG: hypothetical protein Q4C75_03635 [Bergeyella zoohelcum]|nr:hypothetical protein [Bergeyella zoohelcum]
MVNIISQLANTLISQGKNMPISQLADYLNQNGYQTTYGTNYQGGRGTYKLISEVYKSLERDGRHADADNVAKAFTTDNGDYAY